MFLAKIAGMLVIGKVAAAKGLSHLAEGSVAPVVESGPAGSQRKSEQGNTLCTK